MTRHGGTLTFWPVSVVLGLLLSTSTVAYAQSADSLPRLGADRLEPEAYIPGALSGLEHLATHALEPEDRDALQGVQAASKAGWFDADDNLHVATNAYIFDSSDNAERIPECGFLRYVDDLAARYIGCGPFGVGYGDGVDPAQIAGLSVATVHTEQADLESTKARYAITYQQGRLAIRVEALNFGRVVQDLREAEEVAQKAHRVAKRAAQDAFRQLVEEAWQKAKR